MVGLLVLEDGRIHLNYTNKKYDVITTDPISPWIAGSANLYSVDFYKIARRRLKEKGVVCQWIQLGDFSEDSFKVMLFSMRKVFPHLNLFIYSDDAVLIGGENPLQISWNEFSARFESPAVKRDFTENKIFSPFEIINYFYGNTESIDKYLGNFSGFSDNDNVYLEYALPFERYFRSRNLGRQIANQFIEFRNQRMQSLVLNSPKNELMRKQLNFFLNDFTDVPKEVLIDVLSDPTLSNKEKTDLKYFYENQPTFDQKRKQYEDDWNLLKVALENKNTREQIDILNRIRRYPFSEGFTKATLLLISIYIDQGNREQAELLILESKKMSPALEDIYFLEMKLLDKSGEHKKALQVAKEALKYLPQNLLFQQYLEAG